MEKERKLKIGVIGCGAISVRRHLPEYAENENVEIVALKMDSLINNAIKGIILILVILVQVAGPQIREKFRKAA